MQGIIALPSKNQRKKYTHENHLNSSDQLYMQQTNKHQRAGGKVGAWVQKVLEGAGRRGTTTQKYFTHVQVARQPHLGQHLHVPLSQADIVTDWLMSTKKSFSEFENWTSSTVIRSKQAQNQCRRRRWSSERKRKRDQEIRDEGRSWLAVCKGVLADEQRRDLYCPGPSSSPAAPASNGTTGRGRAVGGHLRWFKTQPEVDGGPNYSGFRPKILN